MSILYVASFMRGHDKFDVNLWFFAFCTRYTVFKNRILVERGDNGISWVVAMCLSAAPCVCMYT